MLLIGASQEFPGQRCPALPISPQSLLFSLGTTLYIHLCNSLLGVALKDTLMILLGGMAVCSIVVKLTDLEIEPLSPLNNCTTLNKVLNFLKLQFLYL